MKMNHMESNESILVMTISMLIAGIFSGMNAFINSNEDFRININDIYMSLMMIGIMFILMGIYYKSLKLGVFGSIVSIITFICIRNQVFVYKNEYLTSMIPHHSMAVMMSKELLKKKEDLPKDIQQFVKNIINTQESEINFMKKNIQ